MAAIQPKPAKTIFQEVVKHYKRYLGKRMYEGEGNFRKIRGFFPAYADYLPYFGIRNKNKVLIVEFYVEKGIGTPLQIVKGRMEH